MEQTKETKPSGLTMGQLEDVRERLRSATAQVVDTHDEIDLWWMRGDSVEERRRILSNMVDGLDDDIRQIRLAQEYAREVLGIAYHGNGDCEMNDEPLDEYGCMDCIHDDEEDPTESCYKCSWLMGEGKGYPCLFQPKDEPANHDDRA